MKMITTRGWRRPWLALLGSVAVVFVAFSLLPYLSLEPARSRVPVPTGLRWYYPLLVVHVVCGAIAMLSGCVQIWPWFRRRHPRAHRRLGRLYVFGGVLPAGLIGLVIGALSPFGPVIRVSNVLLALLWLTFTVAGHRSARQQQMAEHQKWMIRSFALTMSVITNRIWGVAAAIALMPQLHTTFAGNEELLRQAIAGIAGWLGWTLPLLSTQWWLEHRSSRPSGEVRDSPAPVGG
ncbi:DUF2306 domain-containing protein [Polyangium sp. 15x6]|uniref:DUF2306 domain-containing protein n=1 Tax=Polyangium sp. 15x6 TaxID=3042687 RepID=UPI00249B495E|nr:DUF2306 domain-containing protein [Polyangium sp. 15x6]MDI3287307.1 DUF2306 domain-containing protein [Polyangium sp. 15x6]